MMTQEQQVERKKTTITIRKTLIQAIDNYAENSKTSRNALLEDMLGIIFGHDEQALIELQASQPDVLERLKEDRV